jgi:hypothetical protein
MRTIPYCHLDVQWPRIVLPLVYWVVLALAIMSTPSMSSATRHLVNYFPSPNTSHLHISAQLLADGDPPPPPGACGGGVGTHC